MSLENMVERKMSQFHAISVKCGSMTFAKTQLMKTLKQTVMHVKLALKVE